MSATASPQFAELGDAEFDRMRNLLSDAVGISFDEKRREVLRLHLRDRAIATGRPTFRAYVDLVESGDDPAEAQRLWNKIAIHQTEFFRNRPQYAGLTGKVLPEVLRVAARGGRSLTLWSAGCSSGEEPYSLAMSVLEALGSEAAQWSIKIVATDLSTDILERAAAGRYEERQMEGVTNEMREKYFELDQGRYVVKPRLRDLIDFGVHNLARDPAPAAAVGHGDIVFCCNVTIYFSREALINAIATLEGSLRPGGYLFLGHSESLWRQPHHLELVDIGNSFAYRKPYDEIGLMAGPVLDAAPVRSSGAEVSRPAPPRQPLLPLSDESKVLPTFDTSAPVVPIRPLEPVESADLRPRRTPTFKESIEIAIQEATDVSQTAEPLEHLELAEIIATAQGHLERGEVDETITLVQAAIPRAPTEAALHFLLGSAEQRLQMHPEAIASLGKAIYCDHTFSLAYFYRAVILEEEGDVAGALTDYKNASRWLDEDHDGRWDTYLESMSHVALVELCRSKVDSLSSRTGATRR